ncbi:site-specific DNA-methyltransferase [Ruminococcus flavefaciens]|uniref:site-specific DNA-methyltransferase n=1 Tax=Ruminococcus flavefaciens TaxID=1265 RepID=UPI0026EC091F|nr:site-specific DNA-methyltransferase [Ruminococcus flavefaciens]
MNDFPKLSEGILGEEDIPKTNTELFLALVGQYFPEAIKDGEVDFTALKEEMGEFAEVGAEHYDFTWAGKQAAKKEAMADIFGKSLRYKPQESLNPDTAENLYIEGDNLEALKLLRRNYHGRIKMIYIDPPYNTGSDFVYRDNFTMTQEELDELAGNIDSEGNRLQKNVKDDSRYHTKWLNMMYPRLKIAKELLTDDGVIFISIDDNEQENLKKICDLIFGENNFINILSLNMKSLAGASGGGEDKRLKKNCEYALVYAKNYEVLNPFNSVYDYEEMYDVIEQYRQGGKTWHYSSALVDTGEKIYVGSTKDGDGNEIKIYRRKNAVVKSILQLTKEEGLSEKEIYYKYGNLVFEAKDAQSSIRQRVIKAKKQLGINDDIVSIEYIPKTGKNKGVVYEQYYKGENCRLFAWLRDISEERDGVLYKKTKKGTYWDLTSFINNLSKEGDVVFQNGKKPIKLLEQMIRMQAGKDDVILDYFSGSATTAHAVMQLNAEDGGNRRYIMIQLPENLDSIIEKVDSTTKKSIQEQIDFLDSISKPHTICEIGKERIRRAAKKIHEEHPEAQFDDGFKVFEVGETTIRWNKINDESLLEIERFSDDKDKIDFTDGYSDTDIVYEIMLRQYGIPLSTPIEKLDSISERTYMFADSVVVCLEPEITTELIEKLAAIEPTPAKYVLRDSAFNDDIELKDESFRRLSALVQNHQPEAVRKSKYNNFTVEFI